MRVLISLVLMGIFSCCDLLAQDATSKNTAKVVEHWLAVAQEMATKQTLSALDAPGDPFELVDQAVFRHTQSIRGGDDIGALYIWKSDSGRPAAIGVFFSWSQDDHRWVMQEFHSLHGSPIKKTMKGETTWTSDKPGLQWKVTKDLPAPGEDPRRLRLQAKRFPALLRVTTQRDDDQTFKLRSVPTPFYEYSDSSAGVIYGAIFGLCQGTDTELIISLEARQSGEERSWYYAFAPFSDYQIEVELPDGQTWKSPSGRINENNKPHYWSFLEKRPKPDFEK